MKLPTYSHRVPTSSTGRKLSVLAHRGERVPSSLQRFVSAASSTDHVLLTRFNLPSDSAERVIRAKQGWLQERVELFERYCIPSVQSQTNKDFHWIIYFDPESPSWLKDLIRLHQSLGIYRPFFRSSVGRDELLTDIRLAIGNPRSEVITSNLDNDDALAVDFTERIRSAGRKGDRTAIYLSTGLIKYEDRLYIFEDPRNGFCSVRESWAAPVGCWCDWHNFLSERMPVIEIGEAPGWLQVIHGRNVSNRIRGARVSPFSYVKRFPGLINDVRVPNTRDIVLELAVWRPARFMKETSRAAAKAAALKLVGREGLTRAKLIWASRRTQS
jgi:hypothetical protein